jgi:hypothetical protein
MQTSVEILKLMKNKKSETIPVTGRGDPYCFQTLRITYFLQNRVKDGGEFVSPYTPQKILRTHFR